MKPTLTKGGNKRSEAFERAKGSTLTKKAKGGKSESLNAWGQDAKTAKAVRSSLRKERAMKSFMKHADERYKAGY